MSVANPVSVSVVDKTRFSTSLTAINVKTNKEFNEYLKCSGYTALLRKVLLVFSKP